MWSRSLATPRASAKCAGYANPALVLNVYGGVFDDGSNALMDSLTAYARSSDDPNGVAAD